jgi:Family of unknown function (DUF5990)
MVRVIVAGHDLPGARFISDGVLLQNVHVAVQVGRDPVGPVRGDAVSARWLLDVRVVLDDGGVDIRGPAVHGKKGERFVYLTWGDVGGDGSFNMFRRAKLMVSDIDPDVLSATASGDGTVIGSLSLTDDAGGPRCGRVRPPVISWRADNSGGS